jgi:ABC-type antimicrobial peptide transport system permease subunit
MINETAAKILGWKDPVGKQIVAHSTPEPGFASISETQSYTIKGVIKDICRSFTEPVGPLILKRMISVGYQSVLFKYREGTWETCKGKIQQLLKEKYPDIANDISINKEDIDYNEYLKSENAMFTILTVISAVCLIVCIFGFVSIVSLTCEERRKEIAIRKINGATIKDILDIFFKEHLTMFAAGAFIAFPVGYIVMKGWLEGYVLQTEISTWIYLSILLVLIMTIVLCVGGRVYKTSSENPINAINK